MRFLPRLVHVPVPLDIDVGEGLTGQAVFLDHVRLAMIEYRRLWLVRAWRWFRCHLFCLHTPGATRKHPTMDRYDSHCLYCTQRIRQYYKVETGWLETFDD